MIVASDKGEPALRTTSTASISIERAGEASAAPEAWAAFADTHFSVEVLEDAQVDSLVKKLKVLNKPDIARHLRCIISDGNEEGRYTVRFE